ncbi:protein fluG-like [Gossypium australe]|uniref:Protein fluG-like n=1 Tax=Gossypium australe TaxID=47621 RepID=A0A5B6VLG0_9ROSI|nr:protein fluG-like [Gossypium australe]
MVQLRYSKLGWLLKGSLKLMEWTIRRHSPLLLRGILSKFCCFVRTPLYGLKQSPTAWLDKFRKAIISFGYQQSNANYTLFIKHQKGKITLLIVYIDDIVITSDEREEIA